jgi:uncharacterized membrane protein YczE
MSPLHVLRRGVRRKVELTPMTPLQQMRAGHFPRRFVQLIIGLWLYGVSMAMFIRSGLGLDPWDVFHYGVQTHWSSVSFGTVVIATSFAVLLLWIPLRQWPGLGTVLNSILIGIATDITLGMFEDPESLVWRWALLLGGIVANGLAGALYIGSQFGTGPRDGLMVGVSRKYGWSLRLVRTSIEIAVLVIGWLLGGVVGVGTVLYALLIGPIVQFFLPLLTVPVDPPTRSVGAGVAEETDADRLDDESSQCEAH